MSGSSIQAESLFRIAEEQSNQSAPDAIKRGALLNGGVTAIDTLLKMKYGVNTTIKLALDGDKCGDSIMTFRLLTAAEEYEILNEMAETGWSYIDIRYQIRYVAKTLSKASIPYHQHKFGQPQLTENDLLFIPKNILLALGWQYTEFVEKHSPSLQTLTQDQINDAINMIAECESDIKKHDLLNGWSLKMTQELLIDSVKKLTKYIKQTEAVLIGS